MMAGTKVFNRNRTMQMPLLSVKDAHCRILEPKFCKAYLCHITPINTLTSAGASPPTQSVSPLSPSPKKHVNIHMGLTRVLGQGKEGHDMKSKHIFTNIYFAKSTHRLRRNISRFDALMNICLKIIF